MKDPSNTIPQELYGKILEGISHELYFRDLKVLERAYEHRGAVPKNFFTREENYCEFTWGGAWRSKEEIRQIRHTLIDCILTIINQQNPLPYTEKMPADHYARYFHALALLNADREFVAMILHPTRLDFLRTAFLQLFMLDDGSDEKWEYIKGSSWHISELLKKLIHDTEMAETIYPDD